MKIITSIILGSLGLPLYGALPVRANWQGRAVPMAFNNQTGEWSILLRLNPATGFWEDFAMPAQGGERGNITAARALQNQTNGKYSLTIQGVPWEKTPNNDVVHFVPVPFISGRDLYTTARNPYASDFTWIPASEIVNSKGDIQRPHEKKPTNVNRGVLAMLRNYLPKALNKLQKPSVYTPPAAALPKPQVAPTAKQPTAAKSHATWLNIPGAVYFYDMGKPYSEFTNFYNSPIDLDGKRWPTTEHYFQAQKFVGTPNAHIAETIRKLPAPRDAFNEAKKYPARADWHQGAKIDAMLKAVRAKIQQHPAIKQLLLNTGDAIIVEASPVDPYWGYGADGKGTNALGQILMHVRKELKAGTQLPFKLYNSAPEYFAANP